MEKFGAMVIATLGLALGFWVGLAVGSIASGMEISLFKLAAARFSTALLGLTFGTLALAVGCARANRGLSTGVARALGVVVYFLNASTTMLAPIR